MPGDFDDFTDGEHKKLVEEKARHDAEQQRQAAERAAKRARDSEKLRSEALPIVDEAAASCRAKGLRPLINQNLGDEYGIGPRIEFVVKGDKDRPHGMEGQYEVEGCKTTVLIEDDKMKSRISTTYSIEVGKGYVGYGEEGLRQSLKYSIASIFEALGPKGL